MAEQTSLFRQRKKKPRPPEPKISSSRYEPYEWTLPEQLPGLHPPQENIEYRTRVKIRHGFGLYKSREAGLAMALNKKDEKRGLKNDGIVFYRTLLDHVDQYFKPIKMYEFYAAMRMQNGQNKKPLHGATQIPLIDVSPEEF